MCDKGPNAKNNMQQRSRSPKITCNKDLDPKIISNKDIEAQNNTIGYYFPTVVWNTLGVLNALRRDRESLIDLDHL